LPDLIVFFACAPFAFDAQQPAFAPVVLAFVMLQFAFSAAVQSAEFFAFLTVPSLPEADAISPVFFTGMIAASFEFFVAEVKDAFAPCMQHEALVAAVHFTAQSSLLCPRARDSEKTSTAQRAKTIRDFMIRTLNVSKGYESIVVAII